MSKKSIFDMMEEDVNEVEERIRNYTMKVGSPIIIGEINLMVVPQFYGDEIRKALESIVANNINVVLILRQEIGKDDSIIRVKIDESLKQFREICGKKDTIYIDDKKPLVIDTIYIDGKGPLVIEIGGFNFYDLYDTVARLCNLVWALRRRGRDKYNRKYNIIFEASCGLRTVSIAMYVASLIVGGVTVHYIPYRRDRGAIRFRRIPYLLTPELCSLVDFPLYLGILKHFLSRDWSIADLMEVVQDMISSSEEREMVQDMISSSEERGKPEFKARIKSEFKARIRGRLNDVLERMVKAKLLEKTGRIYRITELGKFLYETYSHADYKIGVPTKYAINE